MLAFNHGDVDDCHIGFLDALLFWMSCSAGLDTVRENSSS
jgi:hypothetical protein